MFAFALLLILLMVRIGKQKLAEMTKDGRQMRSPTCRKECISKVWRAMLHTDTPCVCEQDDSLLVSLISLLLPFVLLSELIDYFVVPFVVVGFLLLFNLPRILDNQNGHDKAHHEDPAALYTGPQRHRLSKKSTHMCETYTAA